MGVWLAVRWSVSRGGLSPVVCGGVRFGSPFRGAVDRRATKLHRSYNNGALGCWAAYQRA